MLIYQFYQPTAAFGGVPAYPVNAGGVAAPDVTGTTPESGDTLTCTDGIWTGAPTITFTYQWCQAVVDIDDEIVTDINGNPIGVEIEGETANTYEVQVGDVGQRIFCIVTGHNDYGTGVGYSNVVGPVVAGAFVLVANTTVRCPGNVVATSSAIDTTGATLLVAVLSYYSGGVFLSPVSDSKGNTWVLATEYGPDVRARVCYCLSPTVGTGHTFTAEGSYTSMTLMAFGGGAAVFDGEAGGTAASGTTVSASAALTPTASGALVLSVVGHRDAVAPTTGYPAGFTGVVQVAESAGPAVGHSVGYLVQTAASAVDPDWTLANSVAWAIANAAFKGA